MTSCSDIPLAEDYLLVLAITAILVVFVRFVYLKIMSTRRLVGKTICLLREDNDDETWFFNDSSHILVTNKDGITKEYVYRMLRDGKLLIEHYRNNDVVLIDAQNIWKSIIKGETRKEVLISNTPTILASSLDANRGEITKREHVQNAVLADDSRRFFNGGTLHLLKLLFVWSIYGIVFLFMGSQGLSSLGTMLEDLLSTVSFAAKIPEPSVSMLTGIIFLVIMLITYFLPLWFCETYNDQNEEEIKKRATEEYYSMLREKGKYTPEAQLEYLEFEKMAREAEYVKKEKSRKFLYHFSWALGVLMFLFVAFLISWFYSWVAEKIDTEWIEVLCFILSGFASMVISASSIDIFQDWIEERVRKEWHDKWGVEYERKEQELKEKISSSEMANSSI